MMKIEKICLSSKAIDIAEHDNYLELTNRLCYYDDKNLNNVLLPYKDYEDKALECANTLVNMPVQAKYKKIKRLDDLGSHEAHLDKDGDVVFDTESIGTHTEVYIQNDTVTTVNGETKELPCLYAKCRIWKRNKNMIAAIRRLYSSEDGLNTSWEIATKSYKFENGVKTLTDYEFLANTFLGSTTTPAYKGTSKTVSLSSMTEQELMVADALSVDLIDGAEDINNQNKEDIMSKTVNVAESEKTKPIIEKKAETVETVEDKPIETVETSENAPVPDTDTENDEKKTDTSEQEVEKSELTANDLYGKIRKACREKCDKYGYISFWFPADNYVLYHTFDSKELEFLKFTYSVEGDEVTVGEPEKVELKVSIAEINSAIEQRDESLLKANEKIQTLESEIAELQPFKVQAEKAAFEKAEAEKKAKQEELAAYAIKSKFITEEEIKSDEAISKMIAELNEDGIKKIICERLMSSLNEKSEPEIETSSVKEDTKKISINLTDDGDADVSAVSLFLRN